MAAYRVSKPDHKLLGAVRLDGSKSISNRALIIRAFCRQAFEISGLSSAQDTQTLLRLLTKPPANYQYDCGAAGTTFRFLTAYLATQSGSQTLTGSARMLQRPIGPLVVALRQLGARIDYLGEEGYPPLRIHAPQYNGQQQLTISADISSQFISALLLIAPTLPKGLELMLAGKVVSRPYIEMTLRLMQHFGVQWKWQENCIRIAPQKYSPRSFRVEADWSAASYYYAMVALAKEVDLTLHGLFEQSLQGDAVLPRLMMPFGVQTKFFSQGIRLTKGPVSDQLFDYNFIQCPDLAQTIVVLCAGLGKAGCFSGLDTLRIKETDRIAALQAELAKVGVAFREEGPDRFCLNGQTMLNEPVFCTYDDHRMAMALAPLALLRPITIEEPEVVGKSYPAFWKDLQQLGWRVNGSR